MAEVQPGVATHHSDSDRKLCCLHTLCTRSVDSVREGVRSGLGPVGHDHPTRRKDHPHFSLAASASLVCKLQGVTFCLIVIQIHIHFQRVDSTDCLPGTWNARDRSTGIVITRHSGSASGVGAAAIPGPKSLERSSLASNHDVPHDTV